MFLKCLLPLFALYFLIAKVFIAVDPNNGRSVQWGKSTFIVLLKIVVAATMIPKGVGSVSHRESTILHAHGHHIHRVTHSRHQIPVTLSRRGLDMRKR